MEQPQEPIENKENSDSNATVIEDDTDEDIDNVPSGNLLYLGFTNKEEFAYRKQERITYAEIRSCQLRREQLLTQVAEKVFGAIIENVDDVVPLALSLIKGRK